MAVKVLGQGDYDAIGLAVAQAMDSSGSNLTQAEVQAAIQAAFSALGLTVGFKRSAMFAASIANPATQSAVVDFTSAYGFLVLRIPSCANIAAATKLRILTSMDAADTPCKIYDTNIQSQDLATLPTSGTFLQVFPQAIGFRRAQVEFSATPSSGTINMELYGLDLVSV